MKYEKENAMALGHLTERMVDTVNEAVVAP